MYKKILVPIEVSDADRPILEHILPLARTLGSSLVLFHVATGWNAQFFGREADSDEIRSDTAYLEDLADWLRTEGVAVETVLGTGDPVREIVDMASRVQCDLIAMSTHGHRLMSDVILGSTADPVRHRVSCPVLLLRVPRSSKPQTSAS